MAVVLQSDIRPDGVRVEARTKRLLSNKTLPFAEWLATGSDVGIVARVVASLISRGEAYEESGRVVISHPAAAALPTSIADRIDLPPLARVSATLAFDDRVESPAGRIRIRWYDANTRPLTATRCGAFVKVGQEFGRLTGAVFQLTEAIDGYNASVGKPAEERIASWGPVQEALRRTTGQNVSIDQYLGSLTIYQAGSFALDVRETRSGPDFVPVLMSREKAGSLADFAPAAEGDEEEPSGALKDEVVDALLPPELQQKFVLERYEASARTRDAYVLGRNVFVVLDPELKQALDVVRRMRAAPVEARRAFIRNPRPAIAQALGDAGEALAASLFIETQQYSERILGLGVWEKPTLPWLQSKAGQWLPESFALKLGSREILLTQEGVERLAREVLEAKANDQPTISFLGADYQVPDVEQALAQIAPADSAASGAVVDPEAPSPDAEAESLQPEVDRQVLLIKQNIDDKEFVLAAPKRQAGIKVEPPADLMGSTRPKPHQAEGFEWLVSAWRSGRPGVLLADDMGLGKTFQALAFLAWLLANRRKVGSALTPLQRGPILIVAPTALLNNWIAEAERHLAPEALGERVDAFGPSLKRLKRARASEWSPEDALDVERLRKADWILTTYETLADNHRAFARVGYAVAVFDEMQKVKDPRTINTHAAKAMNADFVLGLTGTPIENRLEDLWCIMDRIAPGFLGDLKSFSSDYADEQPEKLKLLKTRLDEPHGGAPALMLRRMKESHVKGLPEKAVKDYPTPMPAHQGDAYLAAVRSAQSGERSHGAMLKAIHALRGISLHPEGADGVDPYDKTSATAWLGRSARLTRAVEILRGIEAAGEKALVFIEDRAVQRAVAGIAATLFGLDEEPAVVNGAVPGHRRQEIVERFQQRPKGFDLLVLSPKAAGIGLTITAANHVIHLSRWWNPAVEDQCNDRCYRIGQDKPVFIHVPMAIHPSIGEASFDITLDRLLVRKRSLSRNMLAPPVSDGDVGALFGTTIASS
ncbi:MAG: DEAD/DEAH box helicase [Rhizobiaceae bacterium]|nr:DEAD/DEAH box helicase [Rhizobiaceae bacterium]MCV0404870.1 DEAD/DEAH box helicase [Rhizobiaceae bacterium]